STLHLVLRLKGESEGDGSVNNPYRISDYAGLKKFADIVNGENGETQNSSACAVLTADIDASASVEANDWTSIGNSEDNSYTGTFDGMGHIITGLTTPEGYGNYAGLFGCVGEGGKVMNVGLEGGSITGLYNVGGVAGRSYGTVTGCYNTGAVSGNNFVGGVVGDNEKGTVTSCYNTGAVSGNDFVGGVVGDNVENCSVENCYNTGSVTATEQYAYAGGMVGRNIDNSKVENCYYDSDRVSGVPAIGITIDGTITNVKGLTTADMTGTNAIGTADNQMNFSDTSVWLVRESDEFYSYYPHLKGFNLDKNGNQILAENIRMADWPARKAQENVREISNYEELKAFAQEVNNGSSSLKGIIVKDIDASASAENNDWTPIGNYDNQYNGTFDGMGHIITGLTTPEGYENYAGLFGCVGTKTEGGVTTKGTVKNVGLEGGSITGKNYVGGLIGNNYGTVTNCCYTGDVSGKGGVGGVAGQNVGTVTNCYNTGSVFGTGSYVGGVVGINYNAVINCYNTGAVSGTSVRIGGVVGINSSSTICSVTVENCYNTGAVSGTSISVGGVVGYNDSDCNAANCYYDKTICGDIGAVYGADTETAKGLTTAQMTGVASNEENTMKALYDAVDDNGEKVWLDPKADSEDDGKYYWFYPHLKGFSYDTEPTAENWPAKVEITVALSDGNSCTYDGDKHGVYVAVGDSSAPEGATVTYSKYYGSAWSTESEITPTDPGNYRMTIRNSADEVIETKYFTILQPDTDYTAFYYKKTGEDWSMDSVDPIDAGDYKAVITFLKTEDNGEIYVPDESHKTIEKEFTIKPKAVTITAENALKVYDGSPLAQSGFIASALEEGDTHTFTVQMTPGSTITNVGTAENVIATVDGVSVTTGVSVEAGNYIVTTANGTLKITPASVTLTANSAAETYDGTAHTNNGYEVRGLVGSDAIAAVVTGSITYPSESPVPNVIESYSFTTGNPENYTVTTVNGELTMSNASKEITITSASREWTYDGSAHSENTVMVTGGSLFEGDELVAEATGSVTNVSDTAEGNNIIADGYKIMHGDKDVTENYVITAVNGTLTINPAKVTVTITGKHNSAPYDGREHTVSDYNAESSNPLYRCTGETLDFNFTGTAKARRTDSGTTYMDLTDSQFVNKNANFDVTFDVTDGYQTIVPISVDVTVKGNSATADYDGNEKSVTGYTAKASNSLYDVENDIEFSGSAEVKLTEPGTESMGLSANQFTNSNENFNVTFTVEEDGKLTVNPVIRFVNEDGTELQSGAVAYGSTPGYTGSTPEKAASDGNTYEFTGWSPEITAATENATYTATYKAVPIKIDLGEFESTTGYKEEQTFTVDTSDLPEGAEIHWFVNGEDVGTGESYTVEDPIDDYTVQAKVIDKDGNVIAESEEQKVEVKNGFFDRLKAFFAELIEKILGKAIAELLTSIC
ncbi:MAG: hypothetical protein J5562_05675, partial [Clostridia bacterium]|nr:hypothetical protein [Clostridia bacterium]